MPALCIFDIWAVRSFPLSFRLPFEIDIQIEIAIAGTRIGLTYPACLFQRDQLILVGQKFPLLKPSFRT